MFILYYNTEKIFLILYGVKYYQFVKAAPLSDFHETCQDFSGKALADYH